MKVTFDEKLEIAPKIFGAIANQNTKSFSREWPNSNSANPMVSALNESMNRQADRLEKCLEKNLLANRDDLRVHTKILSERIDRMILRHRS